MRHRGTSFEFEGCISCGACGTRVCANANNALSLAFALERASISHRMECVDVDARAPTVRMHAEAQRE